MSSIVNRHTKLKTFSVNGVSFTRESGDQAVGDCPFCGKQNHFYANMESRLWDCKSCARSGDVADFFAGIAEVNQQHRQIRSKLDQLAKNRGLLVRTLKKWGVGWDGSRYTIPVPGAKGCTDLRRYRLGGASSCSPGGQAGMVGFNALRDGDPDSIVWVCEGEWDAMALDEILTEAGAAGTVIGVTGNGVFRRDWLGLFQGRTVILLYDNDKAGDDGELRTWKMLHPVAREVQMVHWPEGSPKGYDVRDLHSESKGARTAYTRLLGLLHDAPRLAPEGAGGSGPTDEISGTGTGTAAHADGLTTVPEGAGIPAEEATKMFRQWLYMPSDEPLDVLFGAAFANRLQGEPVWLFLVAPPGGMKSELVMSLSDAPLITAMSSLTPHTLVSGAYGQQGEDPSLLPRLDGKVLTVKDFTSVLNLNPTSRDEIFGILRDAYDGETTKAFGTGIVRKYKSKFGMISGVTMAIEVFGALHSTLGERFLRYEIVQPGTVDVGSHAIDKALSNLGKESNMQGDLRSVARAVLNRKVAPDEVPTIPDEMLLKIRKLAQWVALMRAGVPRERYTNEIMFQPRQEIGTRLAKQMAKLLLGIGIFRRRDTVTQRDYEIVAKVARDTIPSRTESIVRSLYVNREYCGTTEQIAKRTRLPVPTCTKILEDLAMLRVLEKSVPHKGYGRSTIWTLAPSVIKLMDPLDLYEHEIRWHNSSREVDGKKTNRKRRSSRRRLGAAPPKVVSLSPSEPKPKPKPKRKRIGRKRTPKRRS